MPNYSCSIRATAVLSMLFLVSCGSSEKQDIRSALPDTASTAIGSTPLLAETNDLPIAKDSLRSDEEGTVQLVGLSWNLPKGWTVAPPSGPMRVGELRLPGGGSFAIFRFGNGGGSVASNLDRWRDQFSSRDTMWTETTSLPGFPVTLMVVEGTFEDGMGPHGVRDSTILKSEQALLGAILETPDGLVVFKAVLPIAEARANLGDFRKMVGGIRSKS